MALVEEAVPGAVAIVSAVFRRGTYHVIHIYRLTQNAFYSHLHFKAPHLQAQPHTSFEEEVSGGDGSVLPLVLGMTGGV